MKSRIRCQRGNLEYVGTPLKHATIFNYFTDHPTSMLDDNPDYFQNAHNMFKYAGDEIKVSCLEAGGLAWSKALFEVSRLTDREIFVRRVTEWRRGGAGAAAKTKPVAHSDVVKETYVPENCRVEFSLGKFLVVGEASNVIHASGLMSEEIARQIAMGDRPLPSQEGGKEAA